MEAHLWVSPISYLNSCFKSPLFHCWVLFDIFIAFPTAQPCHLSGMSKIVLRTDHHCPEQHRCEAGMLQAQQVLLGAQWQDVLYETRSCCVVWHCPAWVGNFHCAPPSVSQPPAVPAVALPLLPLLLLQLLQLASPPQEIIHFLSPASHLQLFPSLFSVPSLEGTSLHGFPTTFLLQSLS